MIIFKETRESILSKNDSYKKKWIEQLKELFQKSRRQLEGDNNFNNDPT